MTTVTTERDFDKQLGIIFLSRTTLNVAYRIIYPFLPSLARGLGISLAAASGLVTLRVVANMAAPLLGSLADRYGRRRIMEVALVLFVLASALLAGIGTLAAAAIAFLGYGVAKALYDPAVHAYIGDSVPYHQRGRAIGIVEFSWASAWLLGVPAAGFLIERMGWRAPWTVLIILGCIGFLLTRFGLPPAHTNRSDDRQAAGTLTMRRTWLSLLRRRNVVVLLIVGLLFSLAIEAPFIVYGAWLESAFGLELGALGLASAVIGVAEAAAEFGTVIFTDRIGKERAVTMGTVGLAISLALLPWLAGHGLVVALAGVVLMMLTFEFGLVSLLSLATEVAPDARASLLAFVMTAFSLGRILGAIVGGWLWQWENIALQAGIGLICSLLGSLLVAWGIRGVGES